MGYSTTVLTPTAGHTQHNSSSSSSSFSHRSLYHARPSKLSYISIIHIYAVYFANDTPKFAHRWYAIDLSLFTYNKPRDAMDTSTEYEVHYCQHVFRTEQVDRTAANFPLCHGVVVAIYTSQSSKTQS